MTITVFLDPSKMPSQSQDQAAFDSNTSYVMTNLPTFGLQVNSTAANLNSIAAGGAYAIPFSFSDAGSIIGGGGGGIAVNDFTNQTGATTVYVSTTDARGGQPRSILDDMYYAGTNLNSYSKGAMRLTKVGDVSKWISLRITSWSFPGGHGELSVVVTGYSGANPFALGDQLIASFERTGDKGDNGSSLAMLIRDVKAAGTAAQSLAGTAWTTRNLNTVAWNDISGASLGAGGTDTFRLPAGKYVVYASGPAYTASGGSTLKHMIRLYNRTAGSLYDIGSGESQITTSTGGYFPNKSLMRTVVSISATTDFSIDHYATIACAGGSAVSIAGLNELYTEVLILKVA